MFIELTDDQADLLLTLVRDETRGMESGVILYDEPLEALEDMHDIMEQLTNAGAS